jgi:hypothetical protein
MNDDVSLPAPVQAAGASWPLHRQRLGVVLLFCALTAAYTYPQVAEMYSTPAHQDAQFSIWRLEWIARQLALHPSALFDANVFHPSTRVLAFSDATLLQGLLVAPLLWSGVSGVVAYNLLVLATFVLTGVATTFVVRSLTGSLLAGITAGVIGAFAPFRHDHYFHLELLFGFWAPLSLLLVLRALTRTSIRTAVLAALSFAGQLLSCIYYGVFLGTLLACWGVWLAVTRVVRLDRATLLRVTVIALVVMAVAVPYGLPYLANTRDVGVRTLAESASFSATFASYVAAPADNVLYGWTRMRFGANEQQLFPGIVAVLLALTGLARHRGPIVAGLGILLVLAVDLSLGTNGVTFGVLRETVPLYSGLRVPARAGAMVLSILSLLAGYGASVLLSAVPAGRTALRALVCAVLVGAIWAEYAHGQLALVTQQIRPDAAQQWLRDQPPTVVLELPVPDRDRLPGDDPLFQYRSIFHWQRLANGYSGFYPPHYLRMLDAMRTFPDDASIRTLREIGVGLVLIHEYLYEAGQFVALRDALEQRAELLPVVRLPSRSGSVSVYRFENASAPR